MMGGNELLEAFAPQLYVLAYEHGLFEEPNPAIKQRILARKPEQMQSPGHAPIVIANPGREGESPRPPGEKNAHLTRTGKHQP